FPRAVSAGLLSILFFAPCVLSAQQADIPPVSEERVAVEPSAIPADQRIVERRPSFYWLRQKLHPASWIAGGGKPLLRGIETINFKGKGSDGPPAESGIKFGVRGHGQGSGIGPEIKPF